jgi:two-component system nitrogen regulation response regulator GlnG
VAHLEAHDWPGNVRELENSIKRALVLSSGEVLAPEDFSFLVASATEPAGGGLSGLVEREVAAALEAGTSDVYRQILERVEKPLLEAVLAHTEGNQIRAAAILGINRNTLRKKVVELGIDLPGRR